MGLNPKEVQFLLAHEILHCIYDHFGRRDDRDRQMFNVAADYVVNADLKKHKIGEFITSVPCLYDSKYEGWSAEQVYDDLAETSDNIDELIKKLLDEHLEIEKEGDESSKKPSIHEESINEIKESLREAMLTAHQTCHNSDHIPENVIQIIKEFTEPKINWKTLIETSLLSTIKSDFTWLRSSRKSWHLDAILPGMDRDEMIDIVVFYDASGSITDDMLKEQISEVKGITEQFPNFKITLGTFDTKVHNVQIYTSDNLDDIVDYKIHGGGGTDFKCMFDYLKNNDILPDQMIVFTDGLPWDSWGDPNYTDVVWVLHGTTEIEPPFGTWAYYDQT
jgi:predicted metal-dependent peptidase